MQYATLDRLSIKRERKGIYRLTAVVEPDEWQDELADSVLGTLEDCSLTNSLVGNATATHEDGKFTVTLVIFAVGGGLAWSLGTALIASSFVKAGLFIDYFMPDL